jgi:hypothetical protein
LEKAALSSTDFSRDPADFGTKGALSIEQVDTFLLLLAAKQAMLADVRNVRSKAASWQETVLEFGTRIIREGVEGEVGATTKPSARTIEIVTQPIKAVVPLTDEATEDAAGGNHLGDDIVTLIADQAGFDIEDLMLNSSNGADADFNDGADVMENTDGWLRAIETDGTGLYDAVGDGQSYQDIFRVLLVNLPHRFKRSLTVDGRYFVPSVLEEKYRGILSNRGTPLGDATLQGAAELRYQGIKITGVPAMFVKAGAPDVSCNTDCALATFIALAGSVGVPTRSSRVGTDSDRSSAAPTTRRF